MKKHILSIIVLFQVALLSLGVGMFSSGQVTNSYAQSQEVISYEPPTTLDDLQNADDGKLDYWASNLASFDGRQFGIITPARNQGSLGICWAYAAMGAVEANILRDNVDPEVSRETLDLDEIISAYITYHRDGENDPLNLTTNDRYSQDNWQGRGGHADDAFLAMSQGFSPDEQKTSENYRDWAIRQRISPSKYYVQNYVHIKKDEQAIKRAILKYGAVTIEYKSTYQQYDCYYDDTPGTTHASVIVGWNDDVPKESCGPKTPTRDGAWIVKNSWGSYGTDTYNDGSYCYYFSYETYMSSRIYAVDMALKEDYPNLYYYDGNLASSMRNYSVDAQAAIYEAKLSSATQQERLKAVTIGISNSYVDANIKIYKNLDVNPGNVNDSKNRPDQNEPATEVQAHLDGEGLHTIDLPDPVMLEQGEYFSIVVECKNEYGTSVPVVCAADGGDSVNDMTYHLYNGVWTSYKNSAYYADNSGDNMSARIRAVTDLVPRENGGSDLKYARIEMPNRLFYYSEGQPQIPEIEVYFGDNLLVADIDYYVEISNNTAPGIAEVTITGQNAYFGTRETTFFIGKPKYVPSALSGTITVYKNTVMLHDIKIPDNWHWIDGNVKLKTGHSEHAYSLKYDGADAEYYQINTCDVYVNKLDQNEPSTFDLSTAVVKIDGKYCYTGQQVLPSVSVKYNGLQLQESVDYHLTYENNTNVGTATVIVNGQGKYSGQARQTFQIDKAKWPNSRPNKVIKVDSEVTKLSQIPITSFAHWNWLDPSQELTSNPFVALATYTWQDMDSIINIKMEITIVREMENLKDISLIDELSLQESVFTYDGQAKTPEIIARDGDKTLTKGQDYQVEYQSHTNAGQAKAVVRGINSYSGYKILTFIINRADRTGFKVVQSDWTYGENGPEPQLENAFEESQTAFSYSTSKEGDFTQTKPKNAGTYWLKAAISASRNYNAAEAICSFNIAKAHQPNNMPQSHMFVDRKTKSLQSVKLIDGWKWENADKALEGESVTAYAEYEDKLNYDTYRVLITIEKEPPKECSELKLKLDIDTFIYDGELKTPQVIAKDEGLTLSLGTDYDVKYEDNKRAGHGKAIVTFKNDYQGVVELSFVILKAEKPVVNTRIVLTNKKATKLSEIDLPDGFVWEDENMEISSPKMVAKAIYKGDDADCYVKKEIDFEIVFSEPSTIAKTTLIWISVAAAAMAAIIAAIVIIVCAKHRRSKLWKDS